MGEDALWANTTGGYNCAFGHRAGQTNVTGGNNTLLGNLADVGPTNLNNSTAIGANAVTENTNEMILGDNSVYVGIGYSGVSAFPPGKLSVDENIGDVSTATFAGYFHNGDENTSNNSFEKIALVGISDGYAVGDHDNPVFNVGGDFGAQNSEYVNIGIRGRSGIFSLDHTFGKLGIGGKFESKNSTVQNIGAYGGTDASGSNINYGIYGYTPSNHCTTGTCISAAAFFNGDVYCTSGNYWASDIRLKDNIHPILNGLSVIKSLHPKTFNYQTSQFPYITLPQGIQDGLIAQEVQAVLPNLVSSFKIPASIDNAVNIDTTGTGYSFLGVNYIGIIPYLVGAINEQQLNIDSMRIQINNLQNQINNCCKNSHIRMSNPAIDVELSNSIILNQNDPNPFAEETKITYDIPGSILAAKIIFFDNSSQIIQTVKINERGPGQLNVYASNLTSGIYSYSLIADGKVIDTKKMVVLK